jgi:hypothetical protein
VKVVALSRDLILASRILGMAGAAGHEAKLISDADALPPADGVDLLFVNWADRDPGWGKSLSAWSSPVSSAQPRLILYGPHTDLAAHAEARAAGLGPMWARSKLVSELPGLLNRGP